MNSVKFRMREYQLAAFILLAFLIAWSASVQVSHIFPGNQAVEGVRMPCVFGPALGARNTYGNMISVTPAGQILIIAAAFFVVIFDRMWNKLPAQDPATQKVQPGGAQ